MSLEPQSRSERRRDKPPSAERVFDGVLEAVGGTPLIRLSRLFADVPFEVYGKIEALNPGGSIKDRPAREILEQALREGVLGPDSVVVESSSGNMGIGLAQACRYHGLRFICIVDAKTTPTNIAVLRAYGAEVEIVENPDPVSGELLQARLQRVEEVRQRFQHSFWPNQYANQNNSGSHYRTTMAEVVECLGEVDYLFLATSTCGTLRGCGEYIRDHGLATRLVAVDAVGSLIFSDEKAPRSIPGIGAGLKPPLCDPDLVHRCIHVDDLESVLGCRNLLAAEAILAGGSSGAVIAAVHRMRDAIPADSCCVAILPDRGERYLDTIYSEEWVEGKFGRLGPPGYGRADS